MLPVTVLFLAAAACGGGDDGGSGNPDATRTDAADPDASTPDASIDASDPPPDAPPGQSVQCPTPVPAATAGTCDATAGTGTGVLVRGNVLGDGTTYLDGAVLYQGDRLVCVGCDCGSAPEAASATVISCAGAAISPGLINAHDHLNYNERAPLASTAAGGTRFLHRHDWRGGVPTPSNQHGTGETSAGMRWNELRHILSGTTSLVASTRAVGGMRNLDELEPRDTALGFKRVGWEVFPLGDGNETFKPNCTWSYTQSELQMASWPGIVIHVAEGINDYAHEEFRCESSSFDGARDYTEKNVGHIHGVGLKTVDYYNMARDRAKLVWSPRSNISLYGNTAQAPIFARLGGTIALGTDWTYSGSANLPREMACIAQLSATAYNGAFTDEDIWRMATKGGADATGTLDLIGTLTAGKIADLAVYRAAPGQLHRAVIEASTDDVVLVVRDGDVLYGETDVVTALGQTCDPIDVCGDERRVCASREFGGQTFAQLQTAVSAAPAAYPAVFCAAPPSEPTCIPSRPVTGQAPAYSGPTEADPDGDGVTTGDNCPTMFNPVRPIDGTTQPDLDGDGLGDICDPSPLTPDLDGDSIANMADNCPFTGNTPQVDMDMDMKGDACDACPNVPNPAGVCTGSATTIVQIQNGTVTAGTAVTVANVVVTALSSDGFMVQDPTVADGQYAGIYVFQNAAPAVAIGDRVTVAGTVTEYFMYTELTGGLVVSRAAGTPIAPIALTVAQAATEPYEGVLVTLTDITKVDNPYSCAVDGSCTDPRLFEVNDAIVGWDDFYADGTTSWNTEVTAAATDMTPSVTGVMFYRFNRRRICPRAAADITP